ncbi:MAG: hypothetical protein E6G60_12445 [Actinobacteria bacterium]|nr:MAG: hypothetical protein E6G60_12445 [Actinomycetota bacterium]
MARPSSATPQRLILDSGAVIALARAEQRAVAFLRRAVEVDAEVIIPVVVLAETLRGGPRDAAVNRVVNAVGDIEATLPDVGRVAGRLLGRAKRAATVHAMVVAEAVARGGGQVLTGDPADLTPLAENERRVTIHALASRRRGRPR